MHMTALKWSHAICFIYIYIYIYIYFIFFLLLLFSYFWQTFVFYLLIDRTLNRLFPF